MRDRGRGHRCTGATVLVASLLPLICDQDAFAGTMTDDHSRAPLRLLLVAGGSTIPSWLLKCLEDVERSGAARVVLVLEAADTRVRRARRFVQQVRHVLFWLHERMDRLLFRRSPDAFAPMSLRSAFVDRRTFTELNDRLFRALQEEAIDVVLDPLSALPDGSLADLARHGVWSTSFGRSGEPRTQSTPGFWEVAEGCPITETRLCMQARESDKKVSLYESVAPTDRRSVSRSLNHVYWKLSDALAGKMRLLWEDPDAFVERLKAAAPFEGARSASMAPGIGEVLKAWSVLTRRYVSDKWQDNRYLEQWALGFQPAGRGHMEMGAVRRLMPPMDRAWADPFPLQVGNEYYVFHEELLFSTGKGSIVLTVVDDHARALDRPVPILEQDCHLSYPLVFQWDGEFFMIPETESRHQVELYRCITFPGQWELERVLISDVRAFDSTPVFLFGRWWLFATVPAFGAGTTDELHLFCADSLLGPWTPHRRNPIKSDVRSARPAGRVFERHGQFYRPAQDCSRRYGYAVSINRILQLDDETYEECEVDRVTPNGDPRVAGVHTFNLAGDMTVIDCLVRRRKRRATLVASPP